MSELVLQPNVGEDFVRRWLVEHGWVFASGECILEEDGNIYEILHAVCQSRLRQDQITMTSCMILLFLRM